MSRTLWQEKGLPHRLAEPAESYFDAGRAVETLFKRNLALTAPRAISIDSDCFLAIVYGETARLEFIGDRDAVRAFKTVMDESGTLHLIDDRGRQLRSDRRLPPSAPLLDANGKEESNTALMLLTLPDTVESLDIEGTIGGNRNNLITGGGLSSDVPFRNLRLNIEGTANVSCFARNADLTLREDGKAWLHMLGGSLRATARDTAGLYTMAPQEAVYTMTGEELASCHVRAAGNAHIHTLGTVNGDYTALALDRGTISHKGLVRGDIRSDARPDRFGIQRATCNIA